MVSGRSLRIPRSPIRSQMVLLTLVRFLKSSLERKGPSLAASSMESAAFSPRPSMLLIGGHQLIPP